MTTDVSTSTRTVFIDFEFSRITEPKLNMVSCSTYDPAAGVRRKWWLHYDLKAQKSLKEYLQKFNLVIGFSCVAEARSFLSIDLDPLQFRWIDLFFEYRCLTNHNDELQWGWQLVDGKPKKVFKPRPKWEREEGETGDSFRATHSLAEATYKLTGEIRDTDHKKEMRNLIISDPPCFTDEQKNAIMEYNMADVIFLPRMWKEIKSQYFKLDPKLTESELQVEAETRGRFAAHTAIMEQKGYPIDVEKTKNFSAQVGNIIYDMQNDINKLFPDIKPFVWKKSEQRFTWNQNKTRDWIRTLDSKIVDGWMKTDGGNISLSLEAFQRFFDYKHDYPTDNFGAQMVRFLKLKQNIYGFSTNSESDKKTFWDSVGSDGRVRPYLNPYGAQSSRSQPSSTGFMFLKPAWMRALVSPARGKAMCGIDYGSQEFFISALLSGDQNMIKSYLSGDVYLAFAKLAGMVPPDGTKDKYKRERDVCKATVLGISYLMSKYGLAIKLTNDTGEVWTEDDAEEMIKIFDEAYPDFTEFRQWVIDCYEEDRHWKLPCGWYMWGDNENFRSVANCPIQGFGASVMRKAVDLAHSRGLYCPFTLHDAGYIEYNIGQEKQILTLRDCMKEAFVHYFDDDRKELAAKIKLDPFAWSPSYEPDSELNIDGYIVPCSNLYVDERSVTDYNMFSKYFNQNLGDLL